MKKLLFILMGLALGLAMALPARADVDVYANVYKDKDIVVREYVRIEKYVLIDVDVVAAPPGAAEALAVANQTVENAVVEGFSGFGQDTRQGVPAKGNQRFNTIVSSILSNTGITGVNQDSGNFNNQGNLFAVAVTDSQAFVHAESVAEQRITNTLELVDESPVSDFQTPQKADLLQDSMNYNTGITSANQSVGNFNNQLNSVAVAAGLGGALVALAEADLGQTCTGNVISEIATVKKDTISDSINNNHGITSFNQSAGNANNQANVVAISFTHR